MWLCSSAQPCCRLHSQGNNPDPWPQCEHECRAVNPTFYMLLPRAAAQPDACHRADAHAAACLPLRRGHKRRRQLRGVHLRCGVLRAHGLHWMNMSAGPSLLKTDEADVHDDGVQVSHAGVPSTCVLRTVPLTQSGVPATARCFAFAPVHQKHDTDMSQVSHDKDVHHNAAVGLQTACPAARCR